VDHLSELPAAAREHCLDAPPRAMGDLQRLRPRTLCREHRYRPQRQPHGWFRGAVGVRVRLGEPLGLLGSARQMVVEPGLQVAGLCEIEQVFRQLLQLVQGQR